MSGEWNYVDDVQVHARILLSNRVTSVYTFNMFSLFEDKIKCLPRVADGIDLN